MKIAPRFPLEFPVVLTLPGEKRPRDFNGKSENLSLSGLGLEMASDVELPAGSEVKVRLQVDEEGGTPRELVLFAKVVWAKQGRCGLEILSMSDETRAFYENLILGYQTLCRGFAELQMAG